MSLEQLPDELLLIICSYLNQYEILLAFTGLNNRFDQTIREFMQKIDINDILFNEFVTYYKVIFPSIGTHVLSLTISNVRMVEILLLNAQINFVKLFSNLKYLSFNYCDNDKSDENFYMLTHEADLSKLTRLKRLKYLTELYIYFESINDIHKPIFINNIFHRKSKQLEKIVLQSSDSLFEFDIQVPICSHIRDLTIPLKSIDDLLMLCDSIPYVERLDVRIEWTLRVNIFHLQGLNLPNLTELHLRFLSSKKTKSLESENFIV
ncbi:unnamed protein product [Didymodactylos carnosus]|uniref:F-box domain-containing protein n=1 Tax=Didymodactylos carnosus TaxID=1234261 RepID=A0A8S2U5L6_9BILA|nr:unnamed protein product [Didymodactylos carnosus]CAF4322067.1 unnamed protein product [Didymodactylos carnosus]